LRSGTGSVNTTGFISIRALLVAVPKEPVVRAHSPKYQAAPAPFGSAATAGNHPSGYSTDSPDASGEHSRGADDNDSGREENAV
jgi:hypothetical protein